MFDILQGVAISLAARRRQSMEPTNPIHALEVIGKREEKYSLLNNATSLSKLDWGLQAPKPKAWLLHREDVSSSRGVCEFSLPEIFPLFSTLVGSNRDPLVVGFDKETVLQNVRAVQKFRGSNEAWAEKFDITLKAGWNVTVARERLAAISDLSNYIQPIEYRAFDRRWIFYHTTLVWQMAPVCSKNVLDRAEGLVLVSLGKNRSETINGHWIVKSLADKAVVSGRDNASGFPLFIFSDGELELHGQDKRANFSNEFVRALCQQLGDGSGAYGLPAGATPLRVVAYIYALLNSPGYRNHYASTLATGFPQVPLTSSLQLFKSLSNIGETLMAMHLLQIPKSNKPYTVYVGSTGVVIDKVSWSDGTVWIDKAQTAGFKGVPEIVWQYRIGDHQVCEKWLKARGPKKGKPGRTLSKEDIAHYQKIVVAISETIRIQKEIDEVIEAHGGWPGAFATNAPPASEASEPQAQPKARNPKAAKAGEAGSEPGYIPDSGEIPFA